MGCVGDNGVVLSHSKVDYGFCVTHKNTISQNSEAHLKDFANLWRSSTSDIYFYLGEGVEYVPSPLETEAFDCVVVWHLFDIYFYESTV